MTERCVPGLSHNSFSNNSQIEKGYPLQPKSVECLSLTYNKFSKYIRELILRCADTLDVNPDNLGVLENADLTNIFTILKTYLEQVIQAYNVACNEAKLTKEENNRNRVESSAKIKLIADLENRLSTCKRQLEMLHSGNHILEQRNEMFRKQLDKYKKDTRRLTKEQSKAKSSLENLQRQYQQSKRVNEEKMDQLTRENISLENKLVDYRRQIRNPSVEKSGLERGGIKSSELLDKLQGQAMKIEELEKINEKLLLTNGKQCEEGETSEPQDTKSCTPSIHSAFIMENYKLKKCLAQMEAELDRKVLKNHELAAKLDDSENDLNELNVKLCDIARMYDLLKQEHQMCQSIINTPNHDEVPTKEKTQIEMQYEEQFKAMKNELQVLQSQNQKFEDRIRALIESTFSPLYRGQGDEVLLVEIDDPIEYLQERISALLSNNAHVAKKCVELRNAAGELKEQAADQPYSCVESCVVCEKLKDELIVSERTIQELKAEIRDKPKPISKQTKKLKLAAQDACFTDISTTSCHEEEFRLVSAEEETRVAEIDILRREEQGLRSTVKQLEAQIELQMQTEVTLRNKLDDSENYILEIREELRALQQRLRESDVFADSLKEEKEHLNAILQNLSHPTSFKNVKICALREENLKLLQQVQNLNNEVASTNDLKIKLKLMEDQNTSLTHDIEKKEAAIQANFKEINRLNSQILDHQHLQEVLATRDEQISNLENEVASLKCSLEQNVSAVRELQCLLENIQAEYSRTAESFKLKIASLENEKDVLENTNRSLLDKVVKLKYNIRKSNATNESLLAQLKEAAENAVPRTEFLNIQLRYASICAEKESLEVSKYQLETTCRSLSKRIEMIPAQIKQLQESAEILARCNGTSRTEIQSLRKAFSRNKLENEDLYTRLGAIQRDLGTTTTELLNLEQLYKKESSTATALKGQLKNLHAQVDEKYPQMKEELRIATDNVVNLKKLYEQECETSSNLLKEVEKLRNMLDTKQQQLVEVTSTLFQTKTNLGNKLVAIEKMSAELLIIKQLNEKIQEENAVLLQKGDLVPSLENKLEQAQMSLEFLNEHVQQLNNSKCGLAQELSDLIIANQELEVQVQQYSTMLSEVGESIQITKAENTELQEENNQLKLNLRNLHQAITGTTPAVDQSDTLRQEHTSFKDHYEQLLEKFIELENSNKQIQDQNVELLPQLELTRDENVELAKKISELSSTLQNLKKEHNEMCNELKNLQDHCTALTYEKFTKEEENSQILKALNELELHRNDMLHSHVVSIEELNGRLREYDEIQEELQKIKAEKQLRKEELLTQQDKLALVEEKLKAIDGLAHKDRGIKKRAKRDVAILQAKLLKSRRILEQSQKQWEWERSKLLIRIQEAELRSSDANIKTKNRFEIMKNKDTLCSTANLSRIDLINTLIYKGGKPTESYADLQLCSQSKLQSINSCSDKDSFDWKKRFLKVIKHPFTVVAFNMVLAFLFRYTLSRNNLEIVIRRTVPTMILQRESII